MPNEDELIARIRDGDVNALGEFLALRKTRLMGLLRHVTGEHLLRVVELDDLFQEVSKSAVAALSKIPKENLDVDQWLDRLARRRVVDAHREHFGAAKRSQSRNQVFSTLSDDNSRDAAALEQLLIASVTSPSLAVSRNWKLERVNQAVAALSEDQQQMVRLRYVDGLPTAEIAAQLGKSDGAIRVALSRIMQALQSALADSDRTAH